MTNYNERLDKMSDEELYQSITDICFENGGVTKPMADKLMQLIKSTGGIMRECPYGHLVKDGCLDWCEV